MLYYPLRLAKGSLSWSFPVRLASALSPFSSGSSSRSRLLTKPQPEIAPDSSLKQMKVSMISDQHETPPAPVTHGAASQMSLSDIPLERKKKTWIFMKEWLYMLIHVTAGTVVILWPIFYSEPKQHVRVKQMEESDPERVCWACHTSSGCCSKPKAWYVRCYPDRPPLYSGSCCCRTSLTWHRQWQLTRRPMDSSCFRQHASDTGTLVWSHEVSDFTTSTAAKAFFLFLFLFLFQFVSLEYGGVHPTLWTFPKLPLVFLLLLN